MTVAADVDSAAAADDRPAGPDVELARVYRSGLHEGTHYGALVLIDGDGTVLRQRGDVHRPVFHRSCAKPFQAVAMLDAGLRLTGPDLALAAASHTGEAEHVAMVRASLAAGGLTADDLGCPADLPSDPEARDDAVRRGDRPSRVYMNCSGKHAAMLRTCRAARWSTANYLDPAHPLQRRIRSTVERFAGPTHDTVGVDGCGAPVFATDLVGLARGFRALVTAEPGSSARAVADAMRRHPHLVGGRTSGDTLLMREIPGLLVKLGADGVQCFALPDGRAAAFKISDGAERARLPIVLAALDYLGIRTEPVAAAPLAVTARTVFGAGRPVGSVVAAPDLFR
ncbi:asparaginase [Nakamurella sp.]|uniref:asparaginase n=1 Tax=Nakamurella sp. TaxID=1869182 RepID=UPI0037848965